MALLQDDPMYEELHIKEGLDKGYVTVLKDTEQMKTVLNERVEYLEVVALPFSGCSDSRSLMRCSSRRRGWRDYAYLRCT